MCQRLVLIFLILVELVMNGIHCNAPCAISLKSMEVVSSCPLNKTEMEKSSRRKNCQQYINKDAEGNCSDYQKIKYHCVINDSGNQLVEVCAPERKILGFCAEFSEEGAKILGHYYLICTENDYDPACPESYQSSSIYKYKDCYNLTRNVKEIQKEKNGRNTTENTLKINKIQLQQDQYKIMENKFIPEKEPSTPSKYNLQDWSVTVISSGIILVFIIVFFAVLCHHTLDIKDQLGERLGDNKMGVNPSKP